MLYRAQKAREASILGVEAFYEQLQQTSPAAQATFDRSRGAMSRDFASMWRTESPAVRRHYEQLAEQRKAEHLQRYPDYRIARRWAEGSQEEQKGNQQQQKQKRQQWSTSFRTSFRISFRISFRTCILAISHRHGSKDAASRVAVTTIHSGQSHYSFISSDAVHGA
ncbi:hypothetical protein OC835_001467 [Tilletia horrida]|nr:hypothetical protein OC835_001467 [Tilletia horrida]